MQGSGHISSARRLKSPVLRGTGALAWDTSPDQPEDEGILGTSSLPPLRSLAFQSPKIELQENKKNILSDYPIYRMMEVCFFRKKRPNSIREKHVSSTKGGGGGV